MQKVEMKSIGIVKNEETKRDRISHIVLRKDLTPALEGVHEFSHIWVLFWMHKISKQDRTPLKVRPRRRKDMPLLGVFSTRTPHRPNPIGLTRVKLLKVEDNVITVQGLDALHNTPVLDLKPFDYWDITKKVEVPQWWLKMEKDRPPKSNPPE